MEPITENKVVWARFAAHAGLRVPDTLAVLSAEGWGWVAGRVDPVDADGWASVLASLDGDVVIKPSNGFHGTNVRVLGHRDGQVVDLAAGPTTWEAVADDLRARAVSCWLVQRRLRCHPALAGIGAPEALHTTRVITLIDDDGVVQCLAARLRVARIGLIDNFNGGLNDTALVQVDPASGTLGPAVVGSPSGSLVTIDRHFDGGPWQRWTLPDWPQARDLVDRAARAVQPLRTVGWDVAFTADGPVIVEGNMWWDSPLDVPLRATLAHWLPGWRAR